MREETKQFFRGLASGLLIGLLLGAACGMEWAAHDARQDLAAIEASQDAERADWQKEKRAMAGVIAAQEQQFSQSALHDTIESDQLQIMQLESDNEKLRDAARSAGFDAQNSAGDAALRAQQLGQCQQGVRELQAYISGRGAGQQDQQLQGIVAALAKAFLR